MTQCNCLRCTYDRQYNPFSFSHAQRISGSQDNNRFQIDASLTIGDAGITKELQRKFDSLFKI